MLGKFIEIIKYTHEHVAGANTIFDT